MSGVDAAWRLWEMSDLTAPWALRVVCTLGVADLVAEGCDRVDDLAARTGTDASALARVLRHLAARGVITEPEPGRIALTEMGECLRDGHPSRMREWLSTDGAAGRMDQVYAALLTSVRTGEPAYRAIHGVSFYDDLHAQPELQSSFDELMRADSVDYAPIVDGQDWSDVRHVVDVGGGNGELLGHLLHTHDHLSGTLFELPGTADAARARLADLGDRATVEASSFLDEVRPAGADGYVLASVLHNWSDADAAAILGRVAEAAAPGARILVVENVVDETTDSRWVTHLDLKMLVLLGGRERTVAEYHALGEASGLRPAGAVAAARGPFMLPSAVIGFAAGG
ncbi:MAG: methyltransferase [Dermatophilaceae bacterium]